MASMVTAIPWTPSFELFGFAVNSREDSVLVVMSCPLTCMYCFSLEAERYESVFPSGNWYASVTAAPWSCRADNPARAKSNPSTTKPPVRHARRVENIASLLPKR